METLNLSNIYWIGGSPCSGKSTIGKLLKEKYGFEYYQCDNYYELHLELGVKRNYPTMKEIAQLTCDEIWLKPVIHQVRREIQFYKEELSLILEDLKDYSNDKRIIVEGSAILPEFIDEMNIENNHVVFIVPTKEFQLHHYAKREFVPYVLKECSDKKQAFDNWMERDHVFSKEILYQARVKNRNVIINDGKEKIQEILKRVETYFEPELSNYSFK